MLTKSKITILALSIIFVQNVNSQKSVTVGSQIWSTENLNVAKFRNGDAIPEAKTDEEWQQASANEYPAWCYYNNNKKNAKKYGKLYNWYAVNDPRGLAPEGWHIPSNDDWEGLIYFLGGYEMAGLKIKSTKGWNEKK